MGRIDTAEWAEFWQVSRRAVQMWVKAGLPVDRPNQMAHHIISMKRPADGPRGKAEEILLAARKGQEVAGPGENVPPEAKEKPKEELPPPVTEEEIEATAMDLEAASKVCFIRLNNAMKQGGQSSIRFWNSEFIRLQKAIRDQEAHARKMGVDEGSLLSRGDVCRIVWALAFWLMRGIDQDLPSLAPKVLGLTYEEEALDVLDRFFMRTRFLSPLHKAVTCPSGVSLPSWFYDTMKTAVEDFYEPGDGEEAEEFESFMKQFDERSSAARKEETREEADSLVG